MKPTIYHYTRANSTLILQNNLHGVGSITFYGFFDPRNRVLADQNTVAIWRVKHKPCSTVNS